MRTNSHTIVLLHHRQEGILMYLPASFVRSEPFDKHTHWMPQIPEYQPPETRYTHHKGYSMPTSTLLYYTVSAVVNLTHLDVVMESFVEFSVEKPSIINRSSFVH